MTETSIEKRARAWADENVAIEKVNKTQPVNARLRNIENREVLYLTFADYYRAARTLVPLITYHDRRLDNLLRIVGKKDELYWFVEDVYFFLDGSTAHVFIQKTDVPKEALENETKGEMK